MNDTITFDEFDEIFSKYINGKELTDEEREAALAFLDDNFPLKGNIEDLRRG